MYTLEDDEETTGSLRKTLLLGAGEAANDGSETSRLAALSKQITSPLKIITTPVQRQSGGKGIAVAALAVACICVFFTAMDQTVVVTALPPIITSLNIGPAKLDHAAWIVSAYLLGFVIAMPLMGRISDIFGRRRIFLLCLSIFAVGSILCGLAPIFGQMFDVSFLGNIGIDTSSPGLIFLIAARFLQAIGGGAVVPVAMAVAGDFYGEERRGLALGIIGAVTEAGGVIGPLYGALIVQQFGWQYIFYLNVPIVMILMILSWFLIPKGTRLREGIDWLGALLLGASLTCLSLGLAQQGTDLGPTPANSPAPQNNPIALVLAVILLIAFVLVERKMRWPVIDLSLFKRFSFSATSLVSLFVGAALIIAMADIPIFVDTVLQRSVLDSGLALLRMTALIPIGALLGGWLCGRITCRFTAIIGLLFTAVGFYLMSLWPMNVGWTQITISTMTAGLGFGLVIAPIGTTAINSVRATQAGTGSAVVTSLRMVGMMLGLAALTSWALAYFKQLASQYPSLPLTATSAQFAQWSQGYGAHLLQSAHTVYSSVFFVTMFLCLIAIVPAIFLWGRTTVLAAANAGAQFIAPVALASDNVLAPVALASDNVLAPASMPVFSEPVPPIPNDVTASRAVLVPRPVLDEDATAPRPSLVPSDLPDDETTTLPASLAAEGALQEPAMPLVLSESLPPLPPLRDPGNGGGNHGRKRKRRLIIAIASILLVLLLIIAAVFAAFSWQSPVAGKPAATPAVPISTPTSTPVAGPRMIQLALDAGAITSLFASQLGLHQGAISNLKATPVAKNGLVLSLDLNINASGIHRVMPIELDTTLGIDQHQNIQLTVQELKRDGLNTGSYAAAQMQQALNQLLISALMPSLRGELKGVKLISVSTSTNIGCARGTQMLVLLIQAPPIQGIAAQPTPVPFCFKGPIDLSKLLPS
jgi:EmrB/QacA subfamily drug resistance transporter